VKFGELILEVSRRVNLAAKGTIQPIN